jgi:hypothetical protein
MTGIPVMVALGGKQAKQQRDKGSGYRMRRPAYCVFLATKRLR